MKRQPEVHVHINGKETLLASRRWEHHGVVYTIVLMWWLRTAHALGVSPERLGRWYR
ncbi:MAG: hypothetical protein ABR558_10450 [Thioalkalivibrio sp.]